MDTQAEIAQMRHEALNWPTWEKNDEICFNCKHWSHDSAHSMGIMCADYSVCAVKAIEAEEPDTLVLVGPNAHCRYNAEAFEPHPEFLNELADRELPAS